MSDEELLAAVRQHAQENYDEGWDFIVEAYDDEDVLDLIAQVPERTVEAVIERVRQTVEVVQETKYERQWRNA